MFIEQPLYGTFRMTPLKSSALAIRVFRQNSRDITVNFAEKSIEFVMNQVEHIEGLRAIMRLTQPEHPAVQLDAYTSRNDCLFSFVFLDIVRTEHVLVCPSEHASEHHFTLSYREVVQFGLDGALHDEDNEQIDVSDVMMAKFLFKNPHEMI